MNTGDGRTGPRGLTEAEKQLKAAMAVEMQEARRSLLRRHPFIGALAMRLKLTPVVDCRMTTACTDGRNLFADAEFFQRLTSEERQMIIGHEVWHCALRHAFRRGERESSRFNYAADIEVDHLLQQDGFKVSMLPHEPEWLGQSAEFIYDRLLPFMVKRGSGDTHLYPPGNVALPDAETEADGDEPRNAQAQKENDHSPLRQGMPVVSHDRVFDPDFVPAWERKRPSSDATKDRDPDENAPDPEDAGGQDVQTEIAHDWKDFLRHEYRHSKNCGKLPDGIERHIAAEMEKTQNWRRLLLEYVTMMLRGERQWLPPNRRFVHRGLYLPGRARRSSIKLTVALDTSGSTVPDLPQFLGELREMVAAFDEYEITVIQCDCAIHHVETCTADSAPFDPEKFDFSGGGGTDLRPPFDYVQKEMPELPRVLVYLTDGNGPAPASPPNYPVIWCLTSGGRPPADWGSAIHMHSQEENGDES